MMHTIRFGHFETSYTDREHKGRNMIAFPSEYCVIDLETTGRSPLWDRIIEIGILHVVDGAIVDTYQTLVKPSISEDMNYIPAFIEELTGITNEMLDTAPLFSEICHDVQSFIGDRILVGYNVNFDVNFLYDAFMDDMGQPLKNDYIDLLRMARKLHPELSHHRLRDMCDLFEINPSGAHRSIRDCEMTQLCLARLKDEALERYGSEKAFTDTFKKYKYAPRAKYIIAESASPDTDNLLYGKYCVITGKLEKMTRKEAMQLIANIGGINEDGVTKRTNYLILGNNDYCATIKGGKSSKQKKAEALQLNGQDIEIIPENVFYDMIADYLIDTETNPAEPASENQDIKDEQVQMTLTPSTSECPIFGGYSYDAVYDAVLQMVGGDKENVVLKVNKTSVAIYMFDTNAFTIILNSRTKCLKTTSKVAYDYADAIGCAAVTGSGMTIPLDCGTEYLDAVSEMVRAVYKSKQSSISSNMIGCCDMFRMCSDALRCLRSDDPHYNGCYYRKNLEAGRIFYGRNKNI